MTIDKLMSNVNTTADSADIPETPASSFLSGVTTRTLRRWVDTLATSVITIGGLATIISIFGIFTYLFVEVAPLFYSASHEQTTSSHIVESLANESPRTIGVGIDEYMEVGYLLEKGEISFYALPAGKPVPLESIPKFDEELVTTVARSPGKGDTYGLATRDGRVIPLYVNYQVTFQNDQRSISPVVTSAEPIKAVPTSEPIAQLAYREIENGTVMCALTESGRLFITKVEESESGGLFAQETEVTILQTEVTDEGVDTISVLLLDDLGENLIAGTSAGKLMYWDIRTVENPRLMGTYSVGTSITALSYLIGDRSIVVGTDKGTVSVWMSVINPDVGGDPRLEKIRDFDRHHGAVTAISPSLRDKGFVTTDSSGGIAVHHSTSHQTLLNIEGNGSSVLSVKFSPKSDGVVAVDQAGILTVYDLENEHPESTVASLFSAILYEGYEEPNHIWQSTGGSDAFEPKFGLWPLMFGTLKGTIYAMLLATPIAVLAAIYTAMFMNPNVRAVVKPVVEIMEALPTVVLGFLAGLWFAPLLEKIFPAVVAMFIFLPLAILLVCVGWQFLPPLMRGKSGNVAELLALLVVMGGTVWVCLQMNQQVESWLFDSDYKRWLLSNFGLGYDQRNALVIAFAMGMAVIPTIFSISEDSINNVPRHLVAGSLALGATPWQTLTKLVIVSASPGLFSALMIGLGRVVGETMIVLMATGNTPVMDMNLFNGFRTLSANIAVEMPEAPHGGTLYRLLFLAGLILFLFTSVVNTFAEIVRQRLRARYSQF
ncbi:MAG: ABC transporter permease subunit [Nitrospirales bacterium]|nr:ABC transporter permease subunit [Nitrospira sp.]MDR4500038.1 ABC transporter permease subunit [Nitrospirales bacterium]